MPQKMEQNVKNIFFPQPKNSRNGVILDY